MLAFLTQLVPIPGKEADLERVVLQLVSQVRASENGNLLYSLTRNESGELWVWEMYSDGDAVEAHKTNPFFIAAQENLQGVLGGPPIVHEYDVLGE